MNRDDTIDAIVKVLQKYAELQTNLASESARVQVASAILDEIECSVPGLVSLSELVSLPPKSKKNATQAKKFYNDL